MKNLYYKAPKGNFGDDLNAWLWPQIFNDTSASEFYFLGIGSILDEKIIDSFLMDNKKKVVFGSGMQSFSSFPIAGIDETWDIKFLRGPLSCLSLGNKYEYISDAAYTIRQLDSFDTMKNVEKKYKISLMPHTESTYYYDWKSICEKMGYHYISPYSEHGVEFTLNEIAASEKLITEAMHGAIAADILRVPWHRFVFAIQTSQLFLEFKWYDWFFSIGLDNRVNSTFIPLYQKTHATERISRYTSRVLYPAFFFRKSTKKGIPEKLGGELPFYLSNDAVIENIDKKIAEKIAMIKTAYFGNL